MIQTYSFKLGQYNCTSLVDMTGNRNVWETFPDVPKFALQASLDELNMSADWVRHGNVLLIETGQEKILIDAGLSSEANGLLVENLATINISPDEIDIILITHGDSDHIGGLVDFPQAQLVLPQESYRLWTEDVEGMVEEFIKLRHGKMPDEQLPAVRNGRLRYPTFLETNKERLKLLPTDTDIVPGIRFLAAPGHRRDHFAVEIQSGNETLLHVVDAFRHPIQCRHPEFPCLFDSYPQQLAQTTQQLMAHAADTNALVFGSHFIFPGLIHIQREVGKFKWVIV